MEAYIAVKEIRHCAWVDSTALNKLTRLHLSELIVSSSSGLHHYCAVMLNEARPRPELWGRGQSFEADGESLRPRPKFWPRCHCVDFKWSVMDQVTVDDSMWFCDASSLQWSPSVHSRRRRNQHACSLVIHACRQRRDLIISVSRGIYMLLINDLDIRCRAWLVWRRTSLVIESDAS